MSCRSGKYVGEARVLQKKKKKNSGGGGMGRSSIGEDESIALGT